MKESQIKVYLDNSTYITKVNGKTVMVRNKHRLLTENEAKFSEICADLLRGILSKYKRNKMNNSNDLQDKSASARIQTNIPFQGLQPLPLFNPNSNLVGPASGPSVVGLMAPQPGLYRFGDRQMALLPLASQGSPVMLPQMENSYPQQQWMFPLPSNMTGCNFPPLATDPAQLNTGPAPGKVIGEAASVASVSVTKHVCAECGRLRSRKFHHENPIKAGETPIPAFCKKCQKDVTSSEESDSGIRATEKQRQRSTGGAKTSIQNEDDVHSSKGSIGSHQKRRRSKAKVKKTKSEASEDCLEKEKLREKTVIRHMSSSSENDNGVAIRTHHASPIDQALSSYSRSSNSSRGNMERKCRKEVAKNGSRSSHETQQLSPEQVIARTALRSKHTRRANTASKCETSKADSASMQSWRNESPASSEMTPNQASGFEDPVVILSRVRSEDSSRRRPLERSSNHRENLESPRSTSVSIDDNLEVIAERNTWRPRRLAPPEHLEDHEEESEEKTTGDRRRSRQKLAVDIKAHNYYRDDWARVSEQNKGPQRRLRPKDLEKLSLGVEYQPSELKSSSRYRARDDVQHLSRARNLLRQFNENGERNSRKELSIYSARYVPSGSEESLVTQRETYTPTWRQDLEYREDAHPYEKPYVRDATDRGTEIVLKSSPRLHHNKRSNTDANDSELTEEIERVDRRVTFLDLDRREEGYGIASDESLSTRALVEERR